ACPAPRGAECSTAGGPVNARVEGQGARGIRWTGSCVVPGGGCAMRVEVYRGAELAATLEYGAAPRYFGAPGARVRALLAAPRRVRNPWTGAWAKAPRADTPEWWLAGILEAGLGRAGFALAATGAPQLYTRA